MFKLQKLYKLAVILMVIVSFNTVARPSYAAISDQVIINELMYNPASDLDGDEFLELYNTASSQIDMGGWCFTSGISLCFNSGTVIEANSYGVVSRDSAQSLSTYGISTIGTYAGKLDNGGEEVTLQNEFGATMSSLTYDDAAPWSIGADGGGGSLELRDPALDNTLAANWGTSVRPGGTPGVNNSLVGYEPPIVESISRPSAVAVDSQTLVLVKAQDASSVSLVYKEMFEPDQTVSMYDDGNHGDGASGDGTYGAYIPGFSAATLVRYKVVAENASGSSSLPSSDDSLIYYGYRVENSLPNGTTPVLEWYISDDDYADLIDDPSGTDETYFSCIIVYGDQVFDNSKVRLKGAYSRTFEKKPFKVNLPKGHALSMPGVIDTPVSEFHLNTDYPSGNRYVNSLLAWRIFDYAGFATPEKTKVELRRNGAVEGSYTLIEKYDKAWQQDNPAYTSGALYENGGEKKWPDDNDLTQINNWQQELKNRTGTDLRNYIFKNSDVPNLINYMSVQAVIRHGDWSHYQNTLAYQDTADTDRWSFLPWDLDLSFQALAPFNQPYVGLNNMIDPTDTMDSIPVEDRMIFAAVWNDPALKDMYTRRVRTLVDEIYTNGNIDEWLEQEYATAQTAAERDDVIRHGNEEQAMIDYYTNLFTNIGVNFNNPTEFQALIDGSIPNDFPEQDYFNVNTIFSLPDPEGKIAVFKYGLDTQKDLYLNNYVNQGILPDAQNQSVVVKIKSVVNPTLNGGFIKLSNDSSNAIDISGWTIEPLNITLPGGSVLSANSEAYIPVKDTTFSQERGGNDLVLTQASSTLPSSAVLILKRTNQSTASIYTYGAVPDVHKDAASSVIIDTTTLSGTLNYPPSSNSTVSSQKSDRLQASKLSVVSRVQPADVGNLGKSPKNNVRRYMLTALAIAVFVTVARFCVRKLRKND